MESTLFYIFSKKKYCLHFNLLHILFNDDLHTFENKNKLLHYTFITYLKLNFIFNSLLMITNEICINLKTKIKDLLQTILITNILLKCNRYIYNYLYLKKNYFTPYLLSYK